MPFESWNDSPAARGAAATPGLGGARTYRMGRGLLVFTAVAAVGLVGGAVASLLLDNSPAMRIGLALAFLLFAALSAAGAMQVRSYRVTIDDRGIELVEWKRPRRLALDQILGFRRLATNHSVIFLFEPREKGTKPLKVPLMRTMDSAFDTWLTRLPDLDAQETAKAEAELLASSALGATPAERKRKLERARLVAHLLNWPSVAVGLWAFLYPRPYGPVVTAAFLFPLLALAVAIGGRGLFQLLGMRNDPRPQLLAALFVSGLMASIRAFDFDLVAPGALLAPALACGVILTALAALGDSTMRKKPAHTLLVLPFMFAVAAAALTVANCYPDRSAPTTYEAMLLDKHVSKGKSTSWHLDLGPWGPRTTGDGVKVSRALYEQVTVGKPVHVRMRPGRLGFAWFRVVR